MAGKWQAPFLNFYKQQLWMTLKLGIEGYTQGCLRRLVGKKNKKTTTFKSVQRGYLKSNQYKWLAAKQTTQKAVITNFQKVRTEAGRWHVSFVYNHMSTQASVDVWPLKNTSIKPAFEGPAGLNSAYRKRLGHFMGIPADWLISFPLISAHYSWTWSFYSNSFVWFKARLWRFLRYPLIAKQLTHCLLGRWLGGLLKMLLKIQLQNQYNQARFLAAN